MIYKQLPTLFPNETVKSFARIDDDGIVRVTCSEFDQAYLKWVAESPDNIPLPADE